MGGKTRLTRGTGTCMILCNIAEVEKTNKQTNFLWFTIPFLRFLGLGAQHEQCNDITDDCMRPRSDPLRTNLSHIRREYVKVKTMSSVYQKVASKVSLPGTRFAFSLCPFVLDACGVSGEGTRVDDHCVAGHVRLGMRILLL